MKLICKLFGHKIKHGSMNSFRMNAKCAWCDKLLKISYDMSYGTTVVVGDYGNQKTFIWCHCGNELCSTNSWIASQDKTLDIEYYKCTKCGVASKWDFGAPCPILIESSTNKGLKPNPGFTPHAPWSPCYGVNCKHSSHV